MKKYKFKAKIEAGDGGGAYVLFPYDTGTEFATKGKVPVKATFDGVPYTGSLFKYGKPLQAGSKHSWLEQSHANLRADYGEPNTAETNTTT